MSDREALLHALAKADADLKEMQDNHDIEKTVPYTFGYNDGLEWAANWLVSALSGYPETVTEFAKANAMSIRAAKRTVEQENFFDAVRNDPMMSSEQKERWLSLEVKKDNS